jgi:hypothetical protein
VPTHINDPAKKLTAKLKTAEQFLKDWHNNIPRLATAIDNTKLVIQFIYMIEENRDLKIQEWNFNELL